MIGNKTGRQLLIWGGLLFILLFILWGYKQNWWRNDQMTETNDRQIEYSKQEIDDKLNEIAYWGYRIFLADVSGGSAKGETAYRFMNDKYEQIIVAELPDLESGYYYEGWLIRPNPESYLSLGKLFKNVDGRYTLTINDTRNYSDFYKVSVTREPNDGNPEPAEYILSGSFK